MADEESKGSEYPHWITARLTDGLMEAVKAVRRKRGLNRSGAVRQMLTAGALSILGENWRPGDKD